MAETNKATIKPIEASINNEKGLIEAIKHSANNVGVILIKDIKYDSFVETIPILFDQLQTKQESVNKLNKLIPNLVVKDCTMNDQYDNSEQKIDQKKTVDLSDQRISIINEYDNKLLNQAGITPYLQFFDQVKNSVADKILNALYQIKVIASTNDDYDFNYRLIDYPATLKTNTDNPQCGDHRDFGLFTLIFPNKSGLQIESANGVWHDVDNNGHAVLLFGWCAQILSNNKIMAVKHRVIKNNNERRNSAVLFVAPKDDTMLMPNFDNDEKPKYSMIGTSELKERMRNTWKMREGTLTQDEVDKFKDKMLSQGDVLEQITLQ